MELSELLVGASLALKLVTLYFALIVLRFGIRRPMPYPSHSPRTRFAAVIAARNEEAVIARLVKSLLAQEYPRALFDVYVVPNQCTDRTAQEASFAGAEVLACSYPVRQKGDVLRQAFGQLREKVYDAYVVFDADNVVDPHFLSRINDAFCAGARVVKGRQVAANPKSTWVAGCYDIYFSGFDLLFNRPRAAGSLSAKLVGTGFAVRRDVLDELGGWNTDTIAEDAEFSAQCAQRNIPIAWVPDALTYDEEPTGFLASLQQRRRWSSGVMQAAGKMIPKLLRDKPTRLRADMTAFLLMPFERGLSGLLLLISLVVRIAEQGSTALPFLILTMAVSYCGTVFGAVIFLLAERKRGAWNAFSIILFPIFMASWLPIQVLCLFYRTKRWKPMRHTGAVKQVDFA